MSLDKVSNENELLELQRFFAEKIRTPLLVGDRISPDSKIEEMIISNGKTDPTGRLEIYARQYWWRIIGSFDEDFPNVQKLLSKKEYEKLKLEYLVKFPSISFTLRHLGERFSGFVKENQELTGGKMQVVYDAACFDWAKMEAFELANNSPITVEEVSVSDFPSKKLFLQPHVRLLHLKFPIHDLNKQGGYQDKEIASNVEMEKKVYEEEKLISLYEQETFLALHRFQGKIFVKNLTNVEFDILSNFQRGYSLENFANDAVGKYEGMNNEDLQNHFKGLMALGWLYLNKLDWV